MLRGSVFFHVAATLAGAIALMWPALANGYPLVFPDSEAYVEGSYSLRFFVARPIGYSLFLRYTRVFDSLWPAVAIQALGTALLVIRTALVVLPDHRRPRLAAAGALLVVVLLTGAPKYVSWIMPDVFAAWLLLGGTLFVLSDRLSDRLAAAFAVFCGVVVHASNFPIALGTGLLVLAVSAIAARRAGGGDGGRSRRVALRALALAGVVLATVPVMYVVHRAYGHDASPIGGHPAFFVNRLHGAGILVPTLDRYGAERKWALCRYRDELAANESEGSDWFLWARESPRRRLGGWSQESRAEYADIAHCALRGFLPEIVAASLPEAWRQFWLVDSSVGLSARSARPITPVIARRLPGEEAAFRSSAQVHGLGPRGALLPTGIERGAHVALLLAGVALAVACWRTGRVRLAWLQGAIVAFLGVNAFLVGFVSTPSGRLQGRIAWLVAWGVFLAACSLATPREGE